MKKPISEIYQIVTQKQWRNLHELHCDFIMRRVVVTGLGAVTPLGVGAYNLLLVFTYESSFVMRYEMIDMGKRLTSRFFLFFIFFTRTGVKRSWNRLLNGECGVVSVHERSAQFAALPSRVAGCVPRGRAEDGKWDVRGLPDVVVRLFNTLLILCLMWIVLRFSAYNQSIC